MGSLVTLAAFTPCHMTKMTLIARPVSHGAALPARAFCKSGMTVTSQGGSKKELPVVMLYPGSILGPGISKPAVHRSKT